MSIDGSGYWVIGMFFLAGLVLALVPLGLARLWVLAYAPAKPGAAKNATYECGLVSEGDPWIRFKSEYYLYGIIFLVFDVEIIFLLPFAVAFTSLTPGAFVAIMVFLLLLVEGLVWAWRKGLLRWGRV